MDFQKMMRMAMQHSQELAKKRTEDQQRRDLILSTSTLVMAVTINRLIRPDTIEAEFQHSLNEIRGHYIGDVDDDDDDEIIDAIYEITGLAKNIAIDILKIADEMEID